MWPAVHVHTKIFLYIMTYGWNFFKCNISVNIIRLVYIIPIYKIIFPVKNGKNRTNGLCTGAHKRNFYFRLSGERIFLKIVSYWYTLLNTMIFFFKSQFSVYHLPCLRCFTVLCILFVCHLWISSCLVSSDKTKHYGDLTDFL